jgi:hypothetical protein
MMASTKPPLRCIANDELAEVAKGLNCDAQLFDVPNCIAIDAATLILGKAVRYGLASFQIFRPSAAGAFLGLQPDNRTLWRTHLSTSMFIVVKRALCGGSLLEFIKLD